MKPGPETELILEQVKVHYFWWHHHGTGEPDVFRQKPR